MTGLFGLTPGERSQFYRQFASGEGVDELIQRFKPRDSRISQILVIGDRVFGTGTTWQDPANTHEVNIGMLIGCAPGCVLFLPAGALMDNRLLGFLVRQTAGDMRFDLRSIETFPYHVGLDVSVVGSSTTSHARRYRELGAAAWLDFQIGLGHGEIYGSYPFTFERWGRMERWLDYWLPPDSPP